MSNTNLTTKTQALAIAGVLSIFAATSATAAFVPDGTPFNPGIPLAGTANYGGMALSDTVVNFSESANLPPLFTGTLRTVVVQNGGGLLDFYYQIGGITEPQGFDADIFRFTIDGFDPFATGVMDYSTNGLTGITGLVNGAGPAPTNAPLTADRDPSLGTGVGFTFSSFPYFGDPNNLNAGDTSFFMIVRTNATEFTPVGALVSGFGTALVQTSGPTSVSAIPEPGSALIGLAVMGLCGSGLFRRNRKSVVS